MLMINGSRNSHEISETIDLKETAKPNAKYKLLTALVLAVISAASAAASVLNHPLAITARATVGGAVVLQGIALAAAVAALALVVLAIRNRSQSGSAHGDSAKQDMEPSHSQSSSVITATTTTQNINSNTVLESDTFDPSSIAPPKPPRVHKQTIQENLPPPKPTTKNWQKNNNSAVNSFK